MKSKSKLRLNFWIYLQVASPETVRKLYTDLVKADEVYLSTDIDSLWADAEDANAFEASLRIHNPGCHGSWQSWWHRDGDDVQRLYNDDFCCHLDGRRANSPSTFMDYLLSIKQRLCICPSAVKLACVAQMVLLKLFCNTILCASRMAEYLVHDTEDDGVDEANQSHSYQTQEKEVGVAIQLEVGGFWVKDRAHELAFGGAETLFEKNKKDVIHYHVRQGAKVFGQCELKQNCTCR